MGESHLVYQKKKKKRGHREGNAGPRWILTWKEDLSSPFTSAQLPAEHRPVSDTPKTSRKTASPLTRVRVDKFLLHTLRDLCVGELHFAWWPRADSQWMEVSFMFLLLPVLGQTRPHSPGGQETCILFSIFYLLPQHSTQHPKMFEQKQLSSGWTRLSLKLCLNIQTFLQST